ncbi:PAS domain-containing protein (plasmid) [Lichenicola cladoniae]|uniref:histidine kinase n=1 Tax=Lichenicola cladoniae TaxID=1484109 RepID=A0A6M8I1G0_9PROT|nr:PAS domain S-box protein [Lichenicola cladoniae]NPD69671.1 PAS domain-containing protein [Acetobacteraceae bacterium]QKE93955.1 PAS domain-containing protein [Lichenicola cladoniae]
MTTVRSRLQLPNTEAAQSFALFKATVEAVGDAVVVTSCELDPPGPRIEYVNPAFTRMTGFSAEESLGQTPRFLQGPLTDRVELDRLRVCLINEQTFDGEVINYRKDGGAYLIEWMVTPVKNPAGQTTHWLSVQRDVTARKQLEHQQKLLVAELHHRTRNLLAVTRAIALRTLPNSSDRDVFDARLAALGRVQSFLSTTPTQFVSLDDIVRGELEAVGEDGLGQATVEGPFVELPCDKVQALVLLLHECATNAIKHGALSQPDGRLAVRWHFAEEARLVLTWQESGVRMPADPNRRGFGTDLITRALRYQLSAETWLEFRSDGVWCTIWLPAESFRAGHTS